MISNQAAAQDGPAAGLRSWKLSLRPWFGLRRKQPDIKGVPAGLTAQVSKFRDTL